MAKVSNTIKMAICTKANLWMACLKGLDNIHGKMVACIKVILNKAFETDMEFGQIIFPVNKIIKVIIC